MAENMIDDIFSSTATALVPKLQTLDGSEFKSGWEQEILRKAAANATANKRVEAESTMPEFESSSEFGPGWEQQILLRAAAARAHKSGDSSPRSPREVSPRDVERSPREVEKVPRSQSPRENEVSAPVAAARSPRNKTAVAAADEELRVVAPRVRGSITPVSSLAARTRGSVVIAVRGEGARTSSVREEGGAAPVKKALPVAPAKQLPVKEVASKESIKRPSPRRPTSIIDAKDWE
jgi:hypothetical protein